MGFDFNDSIIILIVLMALTFGLSILAFVFTMNSAVLWLSVISFCSVFLISAIGKIVESINTK